MSTATYTLLSQSETISIPIPNPRAQSKRPSVLNAFFSLHPSRSTTEKRRTTVSAPPATKPRGIVGADPGELSIRASMARKKAFQIQSLEHGDFGAREEDIDHVTEEDEKDMEELRFLIRYENLLGPEESCGEAAEQRT